MENYRYKLKEILLGTGIEIEEFHGFLCGLYCKGKDRQAAEWHKVIQDYLVDAGPEIETIDWIPDWIAGSLDQSDFQFRLLIPDDDETLEARAKGLSTWCSGFITGYESAYESVSARSEEEKEIMHDFASIARLSEVVEESADNESDFMELEEYVRMGCILLSINLNQN